MADLQTKLNSLDAERLDYVMARSKTSSATAAMRESGVGKSKYYGWADREELEALAAELRRDRAFQAQRKLDEQATAAVSKLIDLMNNSRSDYVQFQAAQEVLKRTLPEPTRRVDVTTAGEPIREGLAGKSDDELMRLLEDDDE